jgi:CRISPR-associated protein Cas2
MYMLMSYDVEAKRTEKFKKLLRRYLTHTQYSVFSGDITEAQAIKLHRDLSQLMIPGDRVMAISTQNRHNVNVVHLVKDKSGKGQIKQQTSRSHKSDFEVL